MRTPHLEAAEAAVEALPMATARKLVLGMRRRELAQSVHQAYEGNAGDDVRRWHTLGRIEDENGNAVSSAYVPNALAQAEAAGLVESRGVKVRTSDFSFRKYIEGEARLAGLARVSPDQVVEHAAQAAQYKREVVERHHEQVRVLREGLPGATMLEALPLYQLASVAKLEFAAGQLREAQRYVEQLVHTERLLARACNEASAAEAAERLVREWYGVPA